MAKTVKKVSITSFLEKTLGMSASAESMRMETVSRRRDNDIYGKPMNPYRLAKDLADIQADQYKQHAESVTAYAMSEAAARGYGELSVQDVTDKVTESAKNAWKSFLVLIDKLISVIKEFIRGLFDKEKKINGVMKKIKVALKRVSDNSRLNNSKDIKVAVLSSSIRGFIFTGQKYTGDGRWEKTSSQDYKEGEYCGTYFENLISLLPNIKALRSGGSTDTIRAFIVDTVANARNISDVKSNLNLDIDEDDTKLDKTTKTNYSNEGNSKTDIENLDLKTYKEDWNVIITEFNNVSKKINKKISKVSKSEKETGAAGTETPVKVFKVAKSEKTAEGVKYYLQSTYNQLDKMKKKATNKKLEECISALNKLRQSIIKNKDNRFTNKHAQLGRVTISKLTVIYTKSIAMMNNIYVACFKTAAVNISAANSLFQKDTNKDKENSDDLSF